MRSDIRGGRGKAGRTVTLPYLHVVNRGDRVHLAFRRGGVRIPLPSLPLTDPEFLAAYAAARGAYDKAHAAPDGGLGRLCVAAMASRRWKALRASYRAVLRPHIEAIRADYGKAKLAHMKPQHIRADLDSLSNPAPRFKAWRFICADLDDNPTTGLKRPSQPTTDGNIPWSASDIAAFRARWPIGTVARAAMELLFWTGARIGDAVRLGPGMVDPDGVLTYRQAKTGDKAHAPWSCAVPAFADLADRQMMHDALAPFAGDMVFLPAHGRARSVKGFGTFLAKAARTAGLDRSAHGLRKARAVALAEGGATTHQIAAWTGHHSLREVEHYTRESDRRRAVMGANPERETVDGQPKIVDGAASA